MDIFVYGLNRRVRREDLKAMFAPYGTVLDGRIIVDRETHHSKGYGFVTMEEAEGRAAIEALDGTEIDGHVLHVAVANERPAKEEATAL